jgi:hypothetical protein
MEFLGFTGRGFSAAVRRLPVIDFLLREMTREYVLTEFCGACGRQVRVPNGRVRVRRYVN